MNSYRVDYEERTDKGYVHLAHKELMAATSRQALNTVVGGLASAGVHVVRVGDVQLLSPVEGWTAGPDPVLVACPGTRGTV